jgi:FkbM family methyltransferase
VWQLIKQTIKSQKSLFKIVLLLKWRWHVFIDWWGTKVWTRKKVVQVPLGFKLQSGLHPAYAQMRNGTFEIEETAVIRAALQQVDIFVDIGANLGYYSCFARQTGVYVVAFEPQPQNLSCLTNNLSINGWTNQFEIFPLALSDGPGIMRLYGASGPSASLVKGWAGYSIKTFQDIPVNTLDNVLSDRFADKRLLVKIDVEGAEYQVLRGALRTLAQNIKPIWLVEICFDEFHPQGINPDFKAIFDLFDLHGYKAYTASSVPEVVTMASITSSLNEQKSQSGTFNYVFAASSDWMSALPTL